MVLATDISFIWYFHVFRHRLEISWRSLTQWKLRLPYLYRWRTSRSPGYRQFPIQRQKVVLILCALIRPPMRVLPHGTECFRIRKRFGHSYWITCWAGLFLLIVFIKLLHFLVFNSCEKQKKGSLALDLRWCTLPTQKPGSLYTCEHWHWFVFPLSLYSR